MRCRVRARLQREPPKVGEGLSHLGGGVAGFVHGLSLLPVEALHRGFPSEDVHVGFEA